MKNAILKLRFQPFAVAVCLVPSWFLSVVILVGACAASAAEVRQVMLTPRWQRGDTNIRHVQEIDDAAWIWADAPAFWGVASDVNAWTAKTTESACPFFRFRKRFVSDGSPLRFDVSADERFVLFLDGRAVARGPHRGTVEHWYYQTYEIASLSPGEHVLEAVCWQLGRHALLAQLSYRGGFILKAAGAYDAALTTGRAVWEVGAIPGMHLTDVGTSRTFGVGTQESATYTMCWVMMFGDYLMWHDAPPSRLTRKRASQAASRCPASWKAISSGTDV